MNRRSFLAAVLVAPFVPRLAPSFGMDMATGIDVTAITTRVVVVGGEYTVTYLTRDCSVHPGKRVSISLPDGTVLDPAFVRSVETLFQ